MWYRPVVTYSHSSFHNFTHLLFNKTLWCPTHTKKAHAAQNSWHIIQPVGSVLVSLIRVLMSNINILKTYRVYSFCIVAHCLTKNILIKIKLIMSIKKYNKITILSIKILNKGENFEHFISGHTRVFVRNCTVKFLTTLGVSRAGRNRVRKYGLRKILWKDRVNNLSMPLGSFTR